MNFIKKVVMFSIVGIALNTNVCYAEEKEEEKTNYEKRIEETAQSIEVSDEEIIQYLDNETSNYLNADYYEEIDEIYNALHPLGYSNAAIAGIAGNVISESGLNPLIESPYGYRGAYQFSGSLWSSMQSWCSQNNLQYDTLTGQTLYVDSSLDYCIDVYCYGLDGIDEYKTLISAPDAADAFCVAYERCVGGEGSSKYSSSLYQAMGARKENARKVLKYLNDKYGIDAVTNSRIEQEKQKIALIIAAEKQDKIDSINGAISEVSDCNINIEKINETMLKQKSLEIMEKYSFIDLMNKNHYSNE